MFTDKIIHPTAVCWYDEGSCIYSTTILSDTFPMIYEKEDRGYRYRLTINSQSATSSTNDFDQSSIRIIETLIKQALKEQFKCIGSVFYRWDEECKPDGPYDLLNGFRQALCLTESDVTLNVDTTTTRFYPHMELLPFIWERLLKTENRPFAGRLSDQQYRQISNNLKDVEVTTMQSENEKTYVLTGDFSQQLPAQIPVREQNLLNYYKDLGFPLRYPNLYCLKAYKQNHQEEIVDLPIELCQLGEWQQVKEDENTKPVPAPPVNARFHSIMRVVQNCNFDDSALFREIQLEVGCAEMMDVSYDTLRSVKLISVDNAAAQKQRMGLPENCDENEVFADKNIESNLRRHLSKLKEGQCQFVLCLENCQNPQIHEVFKKIACNELGLVTQCANFSKIQRARNLRSYCDNILLSVNAKLSGENKQVADLRTQIKTMYVGADVLHSKNNYSGEMPSIAAVVASMNSECTLTNQRVSRQWPMDGKQSIEAILLLKDMIVDLLSAFRDCNDGTLPERIVFYRDGVDDGQLERVKNEEVIALREAFRAVYPPNSSSPSLTFMVVKKRHHTRLFRRITSTEVANVESGVVVDSCIVNPNYPNFFLNSHEPCLGTNKIGNYIVLVDDTNCSLNDLEELTYSLVIRSSESIPSVVHLADAAASKARQLFDHRQRAPNAPRAEIHYAHEDMQNAPNMF
ncbi:hypothetical protein I4U23_019710 [Adineta vaga]|nr:hypothetical protein I4U23_019710 [Adineta vaga]